MSSKGKEAGTRSNKARINGRAKSSPSLFSLCERLMDIIKKSRYNVCAYFIPYPTPLDELLVGAD